MHEYAAGRVHHERLTLQNARTSERAFPCSASHLAHGLTKDRTNDNYKCKELLDAYAEDDVKQRRSTWHNVRYNASERWGAVARILARKEGWG